MALHILMRIFGVFVVATVCFFSIYNGTTLFTLHPVLMSSGFLLLMSEAIVAFTSNSFVASNLKYNERLTLHWMLQLSAATLIGLAFFSIYSHKNNNNYDHFVTRHASLGLTTCLMLVGTMCGGIAARYSSAFRKKIKPALLKIIHSIVGVITYTMAIITFCLGIDSEWFRAQSGAKLVTILTYSTGILAILALIQPFLSILTKMRKVNNEN
ncbi:cytochrome b561 domain-containing protein 2-like [Contarinia nasturtii]|uniref:cytochrome b561 domain-containing protein 2-like n=1 Tax=Contarinia nasturtii TaxID=265458 RepID=UPI0012D39049|nr:cytochrome b561 domain-containing protein 2-like [Contarinia nasturtii]